MKNVMLGILCWNHWEIAERCKMSILNHTDLSNVKLCIVNNGSDDPETIGWLSSEQVYNNIDILDLDQNYGIVGGMRLAFEEAFADDEIEYVCILNCDVLVTDGWLQRLLDVMALDDGLIAVAPKDNNQYVWYQHFPIPDEFLPEKIDVGLFGDDGKMQKYINEEFYSKRKHPTHVVVECVDPPAALWRKKLVQNCDSFSEEFDRGLGVMELFIRARLKGYRLAYCLSSFVYHYAHGGAGKYEGSPGLNDWVAAKSKEIKARYGVDVFTWSGANDPSSRGIAEKEAKMVRP